MGILRHTPSGSTIDLVALSAIGRSPAALLVVDLPQVSAYHALIRWEGAAWTLRDLDSRNGTFLEGARLGRGDAEVLGRGARIGFGGPDPEWELVDDGPPALRATPVDGGPARVGRGDLLALPDEDEPRALVLRNAEGWVLERQGVQIAVRDGATVQVEARAWTLTLPEVLAPTTERADAPRVSALRLHFRVSADEEQVSISAEHPWGHLDLGVRVHHYLLLTLARARLKDRAAGISPAEEGWQDTETLARRLGMTPNAFYVQTCRARAQLAGLGVQEAAALLERGASGRIRLGVGDLAVARS